jgi:hypothetical protein
VSGPTSQPSPWVPVSERLPPEHQPVLVLLADPEVAIYAAPTVARLRIEFRGTPSERLEWWGGIPGKWMPIRMPRTADGWGPNQGWGNGLDGWRVTHWCRLPEFDDADGEPGEFHRGLRRAAWERHDAGVPR